MKKRAAASPRKPRGRPRSDQSSASAQMMRYQIDRIKTLYGLKTDLAAIRKSIELDKSLGLIDDSEGDEERKRARRLHPGDPKKSRARAEKSNLKKNKFVYPVAADRTVGELLFRCWAFVVRAPKKTGSI